MDCGEGIMTSDGRTFAPQVTALAYREGNRITLHAPRVGGWRSIPAVGSVIRPGDSLGELEILGVLHRLLAPTEAFGIVVAEGERPRIVPAAVAYGDRLLTLDPEGPGLTPAADSAAAGVAEGATGLVFRSPLGGRFYARPAPDKPFFVQAGDIVSSGQTVALLEVMKTFNRVVYGGEGLPERARVIAVVPGDDHDLDAGDVILELEPA
jgi:acetyl-CoA carboxylase biotin carboxyl carrier protein